MMKRLALPILGLLAACGEPAGQSAPTPTPSAAASPVFPAPESLVGEYRVAGIDGADFDASYGIALSIDAGTISYEPTCAGFVWQYAYRDGTLDVERRQEKRNHPPPPVCVIAVPPELEQLAAALDAVNRAGRTPANGIELSGNGRSVLLFSQ